MTPKRAKKLILELLGASRDCALAEYQDGGQNVDIVLSRKPGKQDEIMSLEEAEQLLNLAIRRAYVLMTAEMIPRKVDPVDFINEDA